MCKFQWPAVKWKKSLPIAEILAFTPDWGSESGGVEASRKATASYPQKEKKEKRQCVYYCIWPRAYRSTKVMTATLNWWWWCMKKYSYVYLISMLSDNLFIELVIPLFALRSTTRSRLDSNRVQWKTPSIFMFLKTIYLLRCWFQVKNS